MSQIIMKIIVVHYVLYYSVSLTTLYLVQKLTHMMKKIFLHLRNHHYCTQLLYQSNMEAPGLKLLIKKYINLCKGSEN